MTRLESAPRFEAKRDQFSGEAVRDDIINNVRRYGGWEDISTASAETVDQAARKYIANVDEARQAMVEAAQWQGRSENDQLFIDTLYRTEMVRAWHLRRPRDHHEDFAGIQRAIEWQNKVAHYMIRMNRDLDDDKRLTLERFWNVQHDLIASTPNNKEGVELRRLANEFHLGILRPVAVASALEQRNGWVVDTPPSTEDDAIHKVDLVALTETDHMLLVQIKPPATQFSSLEIHSLDPTRPTHSHQPELRKFWQGIHGYIRKYKLKPRLTQGVYVHLTANKIDFTTGIPHSDFAKEIAEEFAEIDRDISTRLDRKVPL